MANYKRRKPGRKTTACRCCHWGSIGNSKKSGARNPKFLTVTKAARKKLAEDLYYPPDNLVDSAPGPVCQF